ncbi:MAG: hypothetical protein ACSHW1_13070 [Yoonia sp.]
MSKAEHTKKGFAGLFRRQKQEVKVMKPIAKNQLDPERIAKLFSKSGKPVAEARPAQLQDSEKMDIKEMSTLRGALYRRS